ncbi:MAG: GH74, partial [uncultured Gemmatimonadaceae bacterium]
ARRLRVARDRPREHGRPRHRPRRRPAQPQGLLRGHGRGRDLEDGQRRHHLLPALRQGEGHLVRRHRGGAERPERDLRRHRRGGLAQLHLARRRRVQEHRRRQDVEARGAARDRGDRPHRRAPHRREHRLRRRPRPHLGAQQGARALQDHRRRRDLAAREVHQRQGRLRRRGDGPERPEHAVGGELGAAARALLPAERRPGVGALEDHRRRPDVDGGEGGRLPRDDEGAHRARRLAVERARALRARRGRHGAERQARAQARGRSRRPGDRPGRHRAAREDELGALPLRRRRRELDAHVQERGRRAPVLLLAGARRPEEREPRVLDVERLPLLGRRRQDGAARRALDPHRLARDVDRPARPRPLHHRQRRRDRDHARQGRDVRLPGDLPDRAVLRGELRHAGALPRVRRAAGQRLVVRPLAHARPARRGHRGVVQRGRRRRLLHRAGPQRPQRHLLREPGRQHLAPRRLDEPAHDHQPRRRAEPALRVRGLADHRARRHRQARDPRRLALGGGDPAEGAGGLAVAPPLQLGDAVLPLAARAHHGLRGGQQGDQEPGPRRPLLPHLPGPLDPGLAQDPDERVAHRRDHPRQHRRRDARHDHDARRVAGAAGDPLRRHRRRQRVGDAQRRRRVGEPHRPLPRRPQAHLGEPRRAVERRLGGGLRRLRRPPHERLRAVPVHVAGLREDVPPHHRGAAQRRRAELRARGAREPEQQAPAVRGHRPGRVRVHRPRRALAALHAGAADGAGVRPQDPPARPRADRRHARALHLRRRHRRARPDERLAHAPPGGRLRPAHRLPVRRRAGAVVGGEQAVPRGEPAVRHGGGVPGGGGGRIADRVRRRPRRRAPGRARGARR